MGFQISGVSGSGMILIVRDDYFSKVLGIGDIGPVLVKEGFILEFPVWQIWSELHWNFSFQDLEGLKNQRVRGWRGDNFIMDGGINEINE